MIALDFIAHVVATVEPLSDAFRQRMLAYGLDPAKATISSNGTIQHYDGDVILKHKQLKRLPFRFGTVTGSFSCRANNLTSLAGSPETVNGDFWCDSNVLTDLVGGPHVVFKSFYCSGNRLTNLNGAPRHVGANFICDNNQLLSLSGAPSCVGKIFDCSFNPGSASFTKPSGVRGRFYNA